MYESFLTFRSSKTQFLDSQCMIESFESIQVSHLTESVQDSNWFDSLTDSNFILQNKLVYLLIYEHANIESNIDDSATVSLHFV